MKPVYNYNNPSFHEHLKMNRFKGSIYSYTIDETKGIELCINSTSSSELDDEDDDEGMLESYVYSNKEQVYEDLQNACKEYGIEFEDPDTDKNFYHERRNKNNSSLSKK